MRKHFMDCVGAGECFLQVACVWGWRFQSLWIAKGGEEVAKLGLSFICVYVVGSRVVSNSMVIWGIGKFWIWGLFIR